MATLTEKPLNSLERTQLRNAEKVIEKGLATFMDVGSALVTVKTGDLHRETHKTFEAYCKNKWGISRPRAYQLIEAAETSASLSKILDKPPSTESHLHELARVPEDQRANVWQDALEKTEGKPTAKDVREVAETYIADEEEYEEEVEEPEEEPEPTTEELMEESKRKLNTLSREIQSHNKAAKQLADPWLDDRLDILKAALKTAAGVVLAARGEGVCAYCDGEGCDHCLETGWLPKEKYDSAKEPE
jgi:hypothetical protein